MKEKKKAENPPASEQAKPKKKNTGTSCLICDKVMLNVKTLCSAKENVKDGFIDLYWIT